MTRKFLLKYQFILYVVILMVVCELLWNMKDRMLSRVLNDGPTCVLPDMPALKLRNSSNRYKLSCDRAPNIVSISTGKFNILANSSDYCAYRVIKSIDENRTQLDKSLVPFKDKDPIPSDYFKVYCFPNATSERGSFEMKMVAVKPQHSVARRRSSIPPRRQALQYNVVMLGFDSMSRVAFIENLPDVYEMFTKQMKGVVFEKHMVIGDGSTPNLVAVTAGQTVEALNKKYKSVDDFPLIFKSFQNAGYITLFFEDTSKWWGVYQKDIGGFHRVPPIDHYLRPYYLDGFVDFGCLGSLPSYKLHMNLLDEIYSVYNKKVKKFPFIIHTQGSHDDNTKIQTFEEDLIEVLKQFQKGGKFDNSILFMFSDHGARYSSKRSTLTGKYEERLPFLGIYLPEDLQKERPDLLEILTTNSKILTSQFDLYATLKHILGEELPNTLQSKSLFDFIPYRSCNQAGIEAHWCLCHSRKVISIKKKLVISAAKAVIIKINQITSQLRHICAKLKLKEIKQAEQLHANSEILVNVNNNVYVLTLTTIPGDAVFEITVHYDTTKKTFDIISKEISRINRYAPWIKCLNNQYVEMRKFCICKDAL